MDVEKLDCKISCLIPLQKGCIASVFWLGYKSPSFSQSHHLPVTVFAVPVFCFCLSNLSWAVAASVVQRRDLWRVGDHRLPWRWSCGGTLRNTYWTVSFYIAGKAEAAAQKLNSRILSKAFPLKTFEEANIHLQARWSTSLSLRWFHWNTFSFFHPHHKKNWKEFCFLSAPCKYRKSHYIIPGWFYCF